MKIKEKGVRGRRRRCEEGASVEEGFDGRRSYCRQNTFLEEKPSLEVIRNKRDGKSLIIHCPLRLLISLAFLITVYSDLADLLNSSEM